MLGAPVLFIHEPSVFPPPLPSSTEPDGPLDRGLRLWFALACPIVAPPDEDVEPGLSDKPHPENLHKLYVLMIKSNKQIVLYGLLYLYIYHQEYFVQLYFDYLRGYWW